MKFSTGSGSYRSPRRPALARRTAARVASQSRCTAMHFRRRRSVRRTSLLCAAALGVDGAEYSRGYLQHWLRGGEIPERSAQRIFKSADAILRAGRPKADEEQL